MEKKILEELKAKADKLRQYNSAVHNQICDELLRTKHNETPMATFRKMIVARNSLRNSHKAIEETEKALDDARWWQEPDFR